MQVHTFNRSLHVDIGPSPGAAWSGPDNGSLIASRQPRRFRGGTLGTGSQLLCSKLGETSRGG